MFTCSTRYSEGKTVRNDTNPPKYMEPLPLTLHLVKLIISNFVGILEIYLSNNQANELIPSAELIRP